jgi:hypothetical protein
VDKDWQGSPFELSIIQGLNLNQPSLPQKETNNGPSSLGFSVEPPPERFVKMNFDGASKGNPDRQGMEESFEPTKETS